MKYGFNIDDPFTSGNFQAHKKWGQKPFWRSAWVIIGFLGVSHSTNNRDVAWINS